MTERLHFHFSLSHIGEGNGNPLQCSCLENPRDGGAVYGVAQSQTRLKRLSSSSRFLVNWVGREGRVLTAMLRLWLENWESYNTQVSTVCLAQCYVTPRSRRLVTQLQVSCVLRTSERVSSSPEWPGKARELFSSVQFSLSVMSDSLRCHESQHTRPACPSRTPGVHPNSCALSLDAPKC